MPLKPFAGQMRDFLERSGLLEQVGRAGHDFDSVLVSHPVGRLAIHPDHGHVKAADDEQRGGAHLRDRLHGEIRPAASRDYRCHPVGTIRRGHERCSRAGAGAEKTDRQAAKFGSPGQPVHGANQPAAEQVDVEAQFSGAFVDPAFLRRQEIEQQGAEPALMRKLATSRLRGLRRLLPLPWAKTTMPIALGGNSSVP